MCHFREKFASIYVHRMHWHGRQTHLWQQGVIRKCLLMAVMDGFSSSLTIAVRMNMSSPMLSAHLVDSPLSLAVMTGVHKYTLLLESKCKSFNSAITFIAVLNCFALEMEHELYRTEMNMSRWI